MATINIDTKNNKAIILLDNSDELIIDTKRGSLSNFPKGYLISQSGAITVLKGE